MSSYTEVSPSAVLRAAQKQLAERRPLLEAHAKLYVKVSDPHERYKMLTQIAPAEELYRRAERLESLALLALEQESSVMITAEDALFLFGESTDFYDLNQLTKTIEEE